jgi:hypothetical protein
MKKPGIKKEYIHPGSAGIAIPLPGRIPPGFPTILGLSIVMIYRNYTGFLAEISGILKQLIKRGLKAPYTSNSLLKKTEPYPM